jgi:hypothetical protein
MVRSPGKVIPIFHCIRHFADLASSLESVVRDLTCKGSSNLKIIQGRITGVTPDPTNTRITSASLSVTTGETTQLPLALFVNATGGAIEVSGWISEATPAWQVAREAYDPHVIGVSAVVPVPEAVAGIVGEDVGVVRQAASGGKYYSIAKIEHGRRTLFHLCSYIRGTGIDQHHL